jgi:alpha-tubulin suppressor-like RCC1 family protein
MVAIDPNGQVWAWGDNQYGQLGDGLATPIRSSEPVHVEGIDHAVAVAARDQFSVAVTQSGQVWAWGSNTYGQVGSVTDDATPKIEERPVLVAGVPESVAVAAGSGFVVAVTRTGEVWTWGGSSKGQLWPAPNGGSTVPVQLPLDAQAKSVGVGYRDTTVLDTTGTVWKWHFGTSTVAGAFESIESLPEIAQISRGRSHALMVSTEGAVFAFGDNSGGQLGVEDLFDSADPVEVPGLPSMVGVSAGDSYSLALTADGKVWGWGLNEDGQTGDGSFGFNIAPSPTIGLSGIVAVAAGSGTSVAVDSEGLLYTWGSNYLGKLGDGRGATITSPRRVLGVSNIKAIAGGDTLSIALTENGDVYTWGGNSMGAYGAVPDARSTVPALVDLPEAIDSVAVGQAHVVALGSSGSVYTWGQNNVGQLGQGVIGGKRTPAKVTIPDAENDSVVRVVAGNSVSAVVTESGKVYSWGKNDYGDLGTDKKGSVGVPTLVQNLPANDPIVDLAMTNSHSLALTVSNKVYVWGTGTAARLGGQGSGNTFYPPTQVSGLPDDVVGVAAGGSGAFVLTESGDVYAWGVGSDSSLGAGPTSVVPLPIKLDVPEEIADVAPGGQQSLALATSGTVYGAGANQGGGLGIPGLTRYETFTQVPGIADVEMLAHQSFTTLALTGSGELFAWGDTQSCQTGYLPPYMVPTQSPAFFRVAGDPELPEEPVPGEDTVPDAPGSEGSMDDGGPEVPPVSHPPAGGGSPTTAPTAPGQSPAAPIPPATPAAPAAPAAPAVPGSPGRGTAVPRLSASFITVIARAGSTVKIPLAAYVTAGSPAASLTGKVAVAWKASAPKVATLAKSKKTGSFRVKAGSTPRLSIRTAKVGVSKITLKAPGAKSYVITVRAVAKDKMKKVAKVRIEVRGSGITRVAPGSSVRLKAWVSPTGAVRSKAVWKSSDSSIATVDKVGTVTAVGEGKAVITAIVQGKTARKTVTVTPSQG